MFQTRVCLSPGRATFPVCLARRTELCSSWPTRSSKETTTSTRESLQIQNWWVIKPQQQSLQAGLLTFRSAVTEPHSFLASFSRRCDSSIVSRQTLNVLAPVHRMRWSTSQWRRCRRSSPWPRPTPTRWCELVCKTSTTPTVGCSTSSDGRGGKTAIRTGIPATPPLKMFK